MEIIMEDASCCLQRREITTLPENAFLVPWSYLQRTRGVEKVVSGYSGGTVPNPSYQEICTGTTVMPRRYRSRMTPELFLSRNSWKSFFTIHDPTTLNRQGADVGTQYRSAIFYHTPEQAKLLHEVIAELSRKKIGMPLSWRISTPFKAFLICRKLSPGVLFHNPENPTVGCSLSQKWSSFETVFYKAKERRFVWSIRKISYRLEVDIISFGDS